MRPVAIVQARTGSTRFPGKVMAELAGRPLLWHILERLKHCSTLEDIWVATSNQAQDHPIVSLAEGLGVEVLRGDEQDVLARYYETARAADADPIVRITADCPMVDPELVGILVKWFLEEELISLVTNVSPPTFPDGLDVEVFSRALLESAYRGAVDPLDREHVTPWMYRACPAEMARHLRCPVELSYVRLTVDYVDDLEFLRHLMPHVHSAGPLSSWLDILGTLGHHPELWDVNVHIRNEWETRLNPILRRPSHNDFVRDLQQLLVLWKGDSR